MDLNQIKVLILQALFLDDELSKLVVVKGGTALFLLDAIGRRSTDIDFSLCEVPEEKATKEYLESKFKAAIGGFLSEKGYELFHYKFEEKPPRGNFRLGYEIACKFLPYAVFDRLKGKKNSDRMMHQAFRDMTTLEKGVIIQVSKNEFCDTHGEAEIEGGIVIRIYSPEMILIEKLRALCQQMKEYPNRTKKTARAKDFYDIYVLDAHYGIAKKCAADPDPFKLLVKNIFGIKSVPVELLYKLEDYRDYHEQDFQSVQNSVIDSGGLKPFTFYFDYAINICRIILACYFREGLSAQTAATD